jgi:hypothetical protein
MYALFSCLGPAEFDLGDISRGLSAVMRRLWRIMRLHAKQIQGRSGLLCARVLFEVMILAELVAVVC